MSKLQKNYESFIGSSLTNKYKSLLESVKPNNPAKIIISKNLAITDVNEMRSANGDVYIKQTINKYQLLENILGLETISKELKVYDWDIAIQEFVNTTEKFIKENQTHILLESVKRELETAKNSGYYKNALTILDECIKSNTPDFAVIDLLESEIWIPLVKQLYEYCNTLVTSKNGFNPNFGISKIYSPIEESASGYVFHSSNKLFVINEKLKLRESSHVVSNKFKQLVKLTESAKITGDRIRLYPTHNSTFDIIKESNSIKLYLNNKEVVQENLESAFLASGLLKISESQKIADIFRAVNEGQEIKEMDFGYCVKSTVYEGLSASVFTIGKSYFIQKVNTGMRQNELVECASAKEAITCVKEFMNYDITDSIKVLAEKEVNESLIDTKAISEIRERISYINEKIDELKAAKKTIGKSEILTDVILALEESICEEGVELNAILGNQSLVVGKDYCINGKSDYAYQGQSGGSHIFNCTSGGSKPVTITNEELPEFFKSGKITNC